MGTKQHRCQVCVVGGGPAGMMLALLLTRAGIKTLVLERHSDFLRDFRGDTVHPSTLEIFYDLGLLERFLERPHEKADRISAVVGGEEFSMADFSHLPTHAQFIAFMPQWEFLAFVRDEAAKSSAFELMMETPAHDLIYENDRVVGVRAKHEGEELEVRAELVVGCDGRHSTVREKCGLTVHDLGAPIDVLWMRIPRNPDDPPQVFGRFDRGRIFVMLNRGDYWQCAYVIDKGSFDATKAAGLREFGDGIAMLAPFLGERAHHFRDWDEIKLLTVAVDRLEEWAKEGLLCIGDAAHAMSPVGGVGINLAIQDAVAAANILAGPLKAGAYVLDDLKRVQARRMFPTRITQAAQVQAHKRVLSKVLRKKGRMKAPLLLKWVRYFPWVRRIPARIIGIGVRPEHPDPSLFGSHS